MKIEDFVEEMRGKAERGLLEVSRGGKSTEKTCQFQVGSGRIITVRGGIIEKAAISHLILKNMPRR